MDEDPPPTSPPSSPAVPTDSPPCATDANAPSQPSPTKSAASSNGLASTRPTCSGKCGQRAGSCPARRPARPVTKATKSRAGRRRIGLPEQLVLLLRRHRDEQAVERALARNLWSEGGWVFTSPTGEPVNPSTDYQWTVLLKKAGVRNGRLHDARHSAATVLLVLGVPQRTVMAIMGWSTTAKAARYQHVTDPIRRSVPERVGRALVGHRGPGQHGATPVGQRQMRQERRQGRRATPRRGLARRSSLGRFRW
ncbi:MAG: tyrosine-type recombinase/integrase [Actinopolymorphaceae bacterium]